MTPPEDFDMPAGSDTAATSATALAGALLVLGESMPPLFEATDGYRRQAIAAGWGGDAASRIAADYHRYVIESILHQALAMAGQPPTEPNPEGDRP